LLAACCLDLDLERIWTRPPAPTPTTQIADRVVRACCQLPAVSWWRPLVTIAAPLLLAEQEAIEALKASIGLLVACLGDDFEDDDEEKLVQDYEPTALLSGPDTSHVVPQDPHCPPPPTHTTPTTPTHQLN
jgi:hypothetical protein